MVQCIETQFKTNLCGDLSLPYKTMISLIAELYKVGPLHFNFFKLSQKVQQKRATLLLSTPTNRLWKVKENGRGPSVLAVQMQNYSNTNMSQLLIITLHSPLHNQPFFFFIAKKQNTSNLSKNPILKILHHRQ